MNNPPEDIALSERLVRGILHPIFYSESKGKLKKEAFYPPRGRNDVSVLRLDYTTADFCKNHSASIMINENRYCGLAVIRVEQILQVNEEREDVICQVLYTPIINETYHLPMHADLVYVGYYPNLEQDNTLALVRYKAKKIAEQARYFQDPFPNQPDWKGESLDIEAR